MQTLKRLELGRAITLLLSAILICLSLPALAQDKNKDKARGPTPTKNEQYAQATAALAQMHAYLKTSKDLKFTTTYTISDGVLGRKTTGSANFAVRQPNLFRVETNGSGQRTVFVSDGKGLFIYKPSKRKFAAIPARESILGTMYSATVLMNIEARLLDFFWTADYLAAVKKDVRVKSARDASIGGRSCRGLRVVRMEDRFDIWIEKAKPHLPCKLISRRTDGTGVTVYTHTFNWTTSPVFENKVFEFAPPANAKQSELLELE